MVAGKALIPVILPAIKAVTGALNAVIKIFDALGPETRAFASHFLGVGAAMMMVSGVIKTLLGVRGLIGLSKAAATATAANTALAASETAVAGATKAANAEQAKKTSGLQRMRAGVGGMVSRVAGFLPVIGIVGSAMSALFASRRAAEKKEIDRQKKIRAEQAASRQAYFQTIEVVEKLGKVAEKAGEKLVTSASKNRKAAEQSLGTVRDTIVRNLTTAQAKERELLEVGRKLRTFGLTEAEKKRMKQRQQQLRQDILVAEKRASVFALSELKIRAEQAKRIPASKRTEDQNRDIVAANTFKITKMREKEAALQKRIEETRSVFQTKGIKKRRKQLERQLGKMQKAREKFTLRTAKLAGFEGRGVGAAGRAARKFAAPRLAEAAQLGGIEARAGLGRSSLFQIARGTARPELLESRTPEQRAAIQEWIQTVFDPGTEGKFAGARARGPAPAAIRTTAPGAQDILTRAEEGLGAYSAGGGQRLGFELVRALKLALEEARIQVSIDGEDVPTDNKKRGKRTAKGKPTRPAK